MTENQHTLSNLPTHELLEAAIHGFNRDIQVHEEFEKELNMARSQLAARSRENNTLKEKIAEQEVDLIKAAAAIEDSETLANRAIATKNENDKLKVQLSDLQQQLRMLKQQGDPKKLKEQVKRQKEQTEKYQARTKKLELEAKEYRNEIDHVRSERNTAVTKVQQLKKQLAHDTGSGLYHNGDHHLIVWPQKTKMQRPDGTQFEGRSLLYLHQCGRGGLISYDPESGAQLCAAPKGGLRPSADAIEFAQNWLFKVNESQDGIVKDEDMQPINYNSDLN